MGGVQSTPVSGPVARQTDSQDAVVIEMQTMHPATHVEEQTVIDGHTSLLDLKCWQDLPPEEADIRDNRWLLSASSSEDGTQLDRQEPQ